MSKKRCWQKKRAKRELNIFCFGKFIFDYFSYRKQKQKQNRDDYLLVARRVFQELIIS